MATVNGLVSVGFIDTYGIPGQTLINVTVDDTKTVAQAIADAVAFGNDTSALSQAARGPVKLELIAATYAPTGAAGDIEKGGLFNFSNASDAYATGILVPDINPAVLNSTGLIDLTNASVTTWITWLTTAHTALTAVTKGVRALTALKDALIAFRKHRKPLARKTKEL